MAKKASNYFNNGKFEIYQKDKFIYMRNLMSKEDLQKSIERVKQELPRLKMEINEKIGLIINGLKSINPIALLVTIAHNEFLNTLFVNSEVMQSEESIFQGYAIQYLQSVVASYQGLKKQKDVLFKEECVNDVIQNTCEMLKLYNKYYIGFKYLSLKDTNTDEDALCLQMYLELLNMVSGSRYQCFQKQYFEILLSGQDDLISKAYGISAAELVCKLEKYNRFLSFGLSEAYQTLFTSFKEYQEYGYKDVEAFMEKAREKDNVSESVEIIYGYGYFDFERITGLPKKLLNDISFEIGEEMEFSKEPDPFFPSKVLPINKRPLLKVDNNYYCFWSRTLFDKFYRLLYKVVTKDDKTLKELWNKNQKEATENNILNLICDRFGFTEKYTNNYYYKQNQRIENDGIILYENKIIILEVKAGAISNSSIAEDFDSFENNFNDIFNKGIKQGERLIDIISNSGVTLYDEYDNPKCTIPKTENTNIYVINVTIDDMNEITAQFENTKYATYSRTHNCICISLSDLLVYCDYFEDKISFFHFLSKRCKSLSTDKIKLNDELDHLGLYIAHNDYTMFANSFSVDNMSWTGYRYNLDNYYCRKYIDNSVEKPRQELPLYINSIIECLNKNSEKLDCSIDTAFKILDLSSDSKIEINAAIKKVIDGGSTKILFLKGDEINYSFIININKSLDDEDINEHVYATMLAANESNRDLFNLIFQNKKLVKVEHWQLNINDLQGKYLKTCDKLKDIIIDKRMNKLKRKLGRNDLCPCGSGKKYKKCHGKS